jgi:hypothetical protein
MVKTGVLRSFDDGEQHPLVFFGSQFLRRRDVEDAGHDYDRDQHQDRDGPEAERAMQQPAIAGLESFEKAVDHGDEAPVAASVRFEKPRTHHR